MSAAQGFFLVAVAVALLAALLDARTGHIPNWLTLGTLALAPLAKVVVSPSPGTFGLALLGAALCAVLPWLVYRAGGMGGGDVKLFAAVGALLQPVVSLHAVTYAFLVGAAWATVSLARQGRLALVFGNAARLVGSRFGARAVPPRHEMTELRFGFAISLGTLSAVLVCWRSA